MWDIILNDTDWCCEEMQIQVSYALKQAVGKAPVLRHYSLDDEVIIQCDASQLTLGAALPQNGHVVAFP